MISQRSLRGDTLREEQEETCGPWRPQASCATTAYSACGGKRHHGAPLQDAMQQIGPMALPPTLVRVALPVGIDRNQAAVQAMRPGGEEEAAEARSRGDTPVEADGAAGMNRMERREDGGRRCAGGEDRQAVIGF